MKAMTGARTAIDVPFAERAATKDIMTGAKTAIGVHVAANRVRAAICG
jgi:hypothetical protein